MLKKSGWILAILTLFVVSLQAQSGYQLEIRIDNFANDTLYLGNHYGNKQYFKDTIIRNDQGHFVFAGEEAMPGGLYLIIMPPDNRYFEVVIDENDQHFTVQTDVNDLIGNRKIEGSPENQRFYDYTRLLNTKGGEAAKLREQMETADENKQASLEASMSAINTEVRAYQEDIVKSYPKGLTAAIIKATWDVELPEFTEGTEDDIKRQRFEYYRGHYFDHINLSDERLIRGPVLFKKVTNFVENLTLQHPDTINQTLDVLFGQMKPETQNENFKFFLIHFLNQYAKSKFVGMDAVYVHLANNYYCNGKAWWVTEESKEKICKNAATLEPILVGKTAPNIKMKLESGEQLELHDVDSDYTIMFFWDPDCGHCKKSIPKIIEFYDKYSPKGIEIFAICTKVTKDVPKCWETIKERKMGKWVNVVDPYLLSKYKTIYDIRTTPRVFILDKDKKIISKGIAGEQLEEVMEKFLEEKPTGSGASGTGK